MGALTRRTSSVAAEGMTSRAPGSGEAAVRNVRERAEPALPAPAGTCSGGTPRQNCDVGVRQRGQRRQLLGGHERPASPALGAFVGVGPCLTPRSICIASSTSRRRKRITGSSKPRASTSGSPRAQSPFSTTALAVVADHLHEQVRGERADLAPHRQRSSRRPGKGSTASRAASESRMAADNPLADGRSVGQINVHNGRKASNGCGLPFLSGRTVSAPWVGRSFAR